MNCPIHIRIIHDQISSVVMKLTCNLEEHGSDLVSTDCL
jgi:hypothetical protein